MEQLIELSQKLSTASVNRFNNPYASFEWPDELAADAWCFSPELISLADNPLLDSCSQEQLRALALWECVNFFSLNIHGEKELLQGAAARLYRDWPVEVSEYLHHFLDEENKHMTLFASFCHRYGGKVYPEKKLRFPREFEAGEEDFLFFAKIVVFEEIVDYYNRTMALDRRLHPLVRQINQYHHADETRHLAFGRHIVATIWEQHHRQWGGEKCKQLAEELLGYLEATWREYFNPGVYTDAGFDNAYELYERAFRSSRIRRDLATAKLIKFFEQLGLIAPALSD